MNVSGFVVVIRDPVRLFVLWSRNGLGGDYFPQVGIAQQFQDQMGGKMHGSMRVFQDYAASTRRDIHISAFPCARRDNAGLRPAAER